MRKRKFPFFDETPLATANQPEVREYKAVSTLADEETSAARTRKSYLLGNAKPLRNEAITINPTGETNPPR